MVKPSGWYPVSSLGIVFTSLYALVPPYIAYARSNDLLPEELRWPLVAAMGFVIVIMLLSRLTGQRPFMRSHKRS